MKANLILSLLSPLLFLLFCNTSLYAQFETTIGNLAGSDETTDMKPLPNGHSIVLANTTSFGSQKILLIEVDAAGTVVFFKTISDLMMPAIEYIGTSLELDLNAAGIPIGYFITGCRGSFPSTMILLRTDLSGIPTWARQMDNVLPNGVISECGVSLERQSNRDIIVVGRSAFMGDLNFTLSRFSPAGVLIWSNRYGSTTDLQFIPNESCKGRRKGTDVVTVVGHIHDAGIGHTFLSCVRASDGIELWRGQYHSGHDHDDGTDVLQRPGNERYMVVGHAENLGEPTRLWVFNTDGFNGIFLQGATYKLIPPYQSLFARDACLSPDLVTGTITGFLTYVTPFGPSATRTFIMKLPFMAGGLPLFSHYFTPSDPVLFLFGDDAIETVGGANPGYVLGTQAKLPGSGAFDYDVHPLRLDLSGMHGLTDCPVVEFDPDVQQEGVGYRLTRTIITNIWSNFILQVVDQEYIEDPCDDAPGITQPDVKFASFIQGEGIRIYPNPVSPGEKFNLEFDLLESSEVEIQLFDLTGRLCGQWHEYRNEGRQLLQIPLPTHASEKIYTVRLIYSNGEFEVTRLFVN